MVTRNVVVRQKSLQTVVVALLFSFLRKFSFTVQQTGVKKLGYNSSECFFLGKSVSSKNQGQKNVGPVGEFGNKKVMNVLLGSAFKHFYSHPLWGDDPI